MPLEAYLRTLDPDERPVAREWGSMSAVEFQARIGPEVERLADRLGTHHWYDLRLSDIVKIASAGGLGSVVAALITRFG